MSNGEDDVSSLRRYAPSVALLLLAAIVLFVGLPNLNGGNKYSSTIKIDLTSGAWIENPLTPAPNAEVTVAGVSNNGPICFPEINFGAGCVSCKGSNLIVSISGPVSQTKNLGAWSVSILPDIYAFDFYGIKLFPISQGSMHKSVTFSCLPPGQYSGTVQVYSNNGLTNDNVLVVTKPFSFTAG